MANASEPVIRVEGVQKSFGANHVLRGVDFEVMPGEVVTIIGASGSGKSTLLRCINLLETPDAGHVWFHGEDLAAEHVNVNRLRESIGMVFQGFNLFNNMNVMENCVLAPVTLKKCSRAEAEERAILAEADANVARINADAEKYRGEQQAAANEALAASLTDELIAYYQAQQWDGKLPAVFGGETLPILEMGALTESAEAPEEAAADAEEYVYVPAGDGE